MAFLAPAVTWLFTSQSLLASAARFVGASLLSSALNRTSTEGPRLDDLNVQQSSYGVNIPIVYGTVRAAGNIIDASEYLETKHVKKKKKLGLITVAKNTTYTYAVHLGILLSEGELSAGASIGRIWANGKVIFDTTSNNSSATAGSSILGGMGGSVGTSWTRANNTHSFADTIRFYRGTYDQLPDSTLEAVHGVGNVPGYHGVSYVMFENLQLEEFGNAIPNMEIELINTVDPSLEDVVEDIGSRIGVTIYGNRLRDTTCRGYIITNAGHAWSAIEPLAGAYSFDLVAIGSVLRAIPRSTQIRAHIPSGDLAGRGVNEGIKPNKELTRADLLGLPKEVVLSYRDPSRDYQTNSQRTFRDEGDANNKILIEVPITLLSDEARQICDRTLWEAHAASRQVKFSTTSKWEGLIATDLVSIDIGSVRRVFRLQSVQEGRNGAINFEAVFEDPTVYESTISGATGTFPSNTVSLPGQSLLHPIDAAIVDDLDDDAGEYMALSADAAGWKGAVVERSTDGGASYDEVADVDITSVVGYAVGALPDVGPAVIDESSELIVALINPSDTLDSITEAELLGGANLAWLGSTDGQRGEWIQFRDAVALGSPMVYHLTGLVRGKYGTEWSTGTHQAGDVFVLYSADSVQRTQYGAADWDKSRKWRAVSSYTDSADATVSDITNTGEGKRPLSPVQLAGYRDTGDDSIRIEWVRRSRLQSPTLGGGPTPLGEDTELYEVDIYDSTSSPSSVIRTETVTDPEFIYTEAMQTADGHTHGDPVKVAVYQISGVRGRGRPAEGIV